MDRQEALKILVKGGKGRDAMAVIEKWADRSAAEYEEIRADATRTDDYKRWVLAARCTQINRAITDELADMARGVVLNDRNDAKSVFGVADLPGDAGSLVVSRRDAGDRVSSIPKAGELRTMLERATRSGDEVLARAVAERALELRDADTLNRFTEDRPRLEGAVERLWKAEQAEKDGGLQFTVALMGTRPKEFAGTTMGSIEALAHNGEPVGA